ncbi:uncharacterized protein EI90DRAFT_1325234 [Cantharellus anzutake]|uniref:uncharacterized protein n=1 Tax=Cantharellus anzutake TaxID=1750568 RepID=UPI001903F8C9|nr:uncharacterized protein EI90DRAFT_1325234 [Cantharellus anzutake]KAF8342275.1 hypothetical protein EI90DRAFT_1325234 [Cantharellus anzutake]
MNENSKENKENVRSPQPIHQIRRSWTRQNHLHSLYNSYYYHNSPILVPDAVGGEMCDKGWFDLHGLVPTTSARAFWDSASQFRAGVMLRSVSRVASLVLVAFGRPSFLYSSVMSWYLCAWLTMLSRRQSTVLMYLWCLSLGVASSASQLMLVWVLYATLGVAGEEFGELSGENILFLFLGVDGTAGGSGLWLVLPGDTLRERGPSGRRVSVWFM